MKQPEVIIEINGRDFLVREGDKISVVKLINESTEITQIRDKKVIRESTQ